MSGSSSRLLQVVGQDKLLPGRWVLITGASAGIGRAIALAFSEHGKPSHQHD